MNIANSRAEVEKDNAQRQNSHHRFDNQACADNVTTIIRDVTTTGLAEIRYLAATELKKAVSFRALLEADGHQCRGTGQSTMCCCPFHPDRNPSFSIFANDAYTNCFGCGWKGDIFAYEMASRRVDFTTAWINLNQWWLNGPRTAKQTIDVRRLPQPTDVHIFSDKQTDERDGYAVRLETDPWVAERICQLRFERTGERWNPQTLRNMAMDGPLGWAGDCVAFMYPTGTKFRRWPDKEFIWEGEGLSLWRRHHLHYAKHIYLTEGETDAIALVDAGVEDDPYSAVIAVPGAATFQKSWAESFQDKKVTLCFDNDKAGEEGVNKTGTLLQPYASEIFIYRVGRVV